MTLIKWMSASSAADEWEVLSSHLQYLRCEISHITQWYSRATPLSQKLILKIQMGFLQPRAFLLSLSFAACHCEANWKAFSFIKASVEVGSVMQLSYLLSSPGLQQTNLSSQSLSLLCAPWLILDQVLRLSWHSARGPESVPESEGSRLWANLAQGLASCFS